MNKPGRDNTSPRLSTVAALAGVSPITVSRAFSGTHQLAEPTRQKVRKAAEKLGYRPNLLGRMLVQRQSRIVALVAPPLVEPLVSALGDALSEGARTRGYFLLLERSSTEPRDEREVAERLSQLRVHAALVMPRSVDVRHWVELARRGTRVIVVGREISRCESIPIDERAVGTLAAEYLRELGHERFGFVTLDEVGNLGVGDRLEGFVSSLQKAGAELAREGRIFVRNTGGQPSPLQQGELAAERFLLLKRRPSAMFVTHGQVALGFCARLTQRGIAVPEELSVIGCDAMPYAKLAAVPLTTVELSHQELALAATEKMFEREDRAATSAPKRPSGKRFGAVPRIIEPRIIELSSCSPPPKSS